jgi:hypothetical protein
MKPTTSHTNVSASNRTRTLLLTTAAGLRKRAQWLEDEAVLFPENTRRENQLNIQATLKPILDEDPYATTYVLHARTGYSFRTIGKYRKAYIEAAGLAPVHRGRKLGSKLDKKLSLVTTVDINTESVA